MNEFLSKIENFLFDIIGLMLPGLIFILLIILPAYFIGLQHAQLKDLQDSNFLSFLHFISFSVTDLSKHKPGYLIFGLLLAAYIIGHLLKVTSIVLYDFLTAIFDKLINPLCSNIAKWVSSKTILLMDRIIGGTFINTKSYTTLVHLYEPVKRHVLGVFQFRAKDYMPANETIKNDTLGIINTRLNTSFPLNWYSLYKIGTVTLMQEGVKNLSNFFLSKYNLYRSLSLISIFSFFYYLVFFKVTLGFVTADIKHFKALILWLLLALWYTFHSKYKRYWTLCGNETLMALYYYLNKEKLKGL